MGVRTYGTKKSGLYFIIVLLGVQLKLEVGVERFALLKTIKQKEKKGEKRKRKNNDVGLSLKSSEPKALFIPENTLF